MQSIIEHHPDLVRYQSEAEALRDELAQLRADAIEAENPTKMAADLEKWFLELQMENDVSSMIMSKLRATRL